MNITLPELSLVLLIGPSGSGKSTFALEHFRPTEVISSDYCRGLVSDDENDQSATVAAFELLHVIAAKRLARGRITVVDATSVRPEDRKPLVQLAREYHCLPVAIVFNLPEKVCHQRNLSRADREFGPHVIRSQRGQLRRSLRGLRREGFRHVFVFESPEEVEAATVQREPLWNNKRDERGPFDIIGDVHGCCDELEALLKRLGYVQVDIVAPEQGDESAYSSAGQRPSPPAISRCHTEGEVSRRQGVDESGRSRGQGGDESEDPRRLKPAAQEITSGAISRCHTEKVYAHPEGRKAIFLGDLVDRGPRVLDTVRLVQRIVEAGQALAVPGNHDMKLVRKLRGKDVRITHGLAETLAEFDALPADVREATSKEIVVFLDSLVSHYVLDEGKLVVAHAGMKEELQGRGSGKVREFALYGETTGETDEFGLPVRYNWAAQYRGQAMVVYGHTPVPEAEWLNRTINIDTGCVFGGKLTALRYPERELVSVPASRTYCEPAKPFLPVDQAASSLSAQQLHDDVLDLSDVMGKRIISTRFRQTVTIREENAAAALEVMSRFAADPKWLIYLPPTMSPCATSSLPDYLEYPTEAFSYYRSEGIGRVICEEKHMGSRAVVIVCRDAEAARRRFGVADESTGIIHTRTGRRFFDDGTLEAELLDLLRSALASAGFWDEFATDWVCLDCELMPWSAKAQELLKQQYAAVGAAAGASLGQAVAALESAGTHGVPIDHLLERYRNKSRQVADYVDAYGRYCWPVQSLRDLKLAPFHILATEGKVHVDRDHVWHMETIAEVCEAGDSLLMATACKPVDLSDSASEQAGVQWWLDLTGRGGEGMVVKPIDFIVRGRRGMAQPAVKCRGREYLRIIYGPAYTSPEHLDRLRQRGLGRKRSLAVREFALGVEGLERFVRGEPLRRVHECVFGVLALESEPVDPRL